MRPRFLLDEHVDRAIVRQLRLMAPDIELTVIGERGAPPQGTPDEDILVRAEAHGYILVTNNRRSMPAHLEHHFGGGRHIPGLFWMHPGSSLSAIIETLFLVWEASEAEEYTDRLLFIPY